MSEEQKQKISLSNKGRIVSEETRKKLSEANKGKYIGIKSPSFGTHLTEERKNYLSIINTGKHFSMETRKKISDAQKGKTRKPLSDQTKLKISKSTLGKKRNLMQRQNISNSLKGKKIAEIPLLKRIETKRGGFWYGAVTYPDPPKYCEKFTLDFRERVRAFWDYQCFECGTQSNSLCVHHIHYDKKMCCNGSPRDVVPLCASCHAKTNYNRDYWENYFTELLYMYCPGGKCFFTNKEMQQYTTDSLA
ncbi:MAG: NUMOD3 domain-containing DNA-binding protein [Alphaproteobacteria bacterium]|nr:NUMOD3 domain-containing DNA-binding protein [Alphaproteobacteria bacterium]